LGDRNGGLCFSHLFSHDRKFKLFLFWTGKICIFFIIKSINLWTIFFRNKYPMAPLLNGRSLKVAWPRKWMDFLIMLYHRRKNMWVFSDILQGDDIQSLIHNDMSFVAKQQIPILTYSQTCIKDSPLGQRKGGLLRQVTS
jgi:hypothetical protein